MGIPRFFRIPSHRQFNFFPRYFDPDKEELEERIQEAKKKYGLEEKNEDEPYVPHIKGKMRSYFRQSKKSKKQSNIRLLIIIAALFLLAYYLLMS